MTAASIIDGHLSVRSRTWCIVSASTIDGEEPAMSPQLTVWYNTKCPVCNAGIDWQKSRLVRAARAGAIEFRDINCEPDALARFGAGVNDVRRRLYGVDADGRLYVGIDCAIAIWLRTPGDAW